jgi:hypothetical protein
MLEGADRRTAESIGGEQEFAAELSRALGPLFRVSLLDEGGNVAASFGAPPRAAGSRRRIPLPGSARSLLLEVDEGQLSAAIQTIQSLLGQDQPPRQVAAGTFTRVDRALDELIALAEHQVGRPIAQMSRAEKQSVVRILDQRGAFAVRKSVETVAEALGVSRFTVYNYLDSIREQEPPVAD